MSIIDEVDKFMLSSTTNKWIGDNYLMVYVRKGRRIIDGSIYNTFDVANIKNEPKFQCKGHFKAFMLKVESLDLPVFVECIHNPNLVTMLVKNGYNIIKQDYTTHAIKHPKDKLHD